MSTFVPPQAVILTSAVPNFNSANTFGLASAVTVTASDLNTATGVFLAVNNTILTSNEDDFINAGAGDDIVVARAGDDTVAGGLGDDSIFGGAGDDDIAGGFGDDFILGGAGADRISGNAGDDFINGNAGDDDLFGNAGFDFILGGGGDDFISGGTGDDTLNGNSGFDFINGNAGDDEIFGGFGFDILNGGFGDDTIEGGFGDDTLTGGAGADVFVFNIVDALTPGNDDVITDFNVFEDVIRLEFFGLEGLGGFGGVADFTTFFNATEGIDQTFTGVGDDTVIDGGASPFLNLLGGSLGAGGSITIENVEIDSLGAANFDFVF